MKYPYEYNNYSKQNDTMYYNLRILLVKTHYSNMKQLTKLVEKYNSYNCPCVISLTITEDEGNEGYKNWLYNESKLKLAIHK